MAELGICYLEGTCNIKQSKELGLYWLNEAIKNGYHKAMYFLGNYYINGKFVEKDEKKGAELLTKCIFHNDSAAYLSLALCYKDGKGVEKNIPKFIECLKVAAKDNRPNLCKLLFEIYTDDLYVEPDLDEARKWLKLYHEQIKDKK